MATIQAKNNPASRVEAGDHVIESAKTAETKSVKTKLLVFTKAHAAYVAAHAAAQKSEAALHAAQDALGEEDAAQDTAAQALAAKMIGDGAPKANPFSLFGLPAPSALIDMAVAKEVKTTATLAKRAAKWKSAGAATKAAAGALAKKSASTAKAQTRIPALEKAQAAAIAKRDALGVPWARAFNHLKNAARAAEDDGATGLFAALFDVTRPARAKGAGAKTGDGAPPAKAPAAPPAS
jgi:hypothetical protein